jgi:hypothetical protein
MTVDAKSHPKYSLLLTVFSVSLLVFISVALDLGVIRRIGGLSNGYCSREKYSPALHVYIQTKDNNWKIL